MQISVKKNQPLRKIFAMNVGVKNLNRKSKSMRKLISLRKCKLTGVTERAFLKMLGTLSKI